MQAPAQGAAIVESGENVATTAQKVALNGRTAPASMPAAAGEPARPAGQGSGQTEAPVVLLEAERTDRRRAKKQRQKTARAARAAAQEPEPTQAQVNIRTQFSHSNIPLLPPCLHDFLWKFPSMFFRTWRIVLQCPYRLPLSHWCYAGRRPGGCWQPACRAVRKQQHDTAGSTAASHYRAAIPGASSQKSRSRGSHRAKNPGAGSGLERSCHSSL